MAARAFALGALAKMLFHLMILDFAALCAASPLLEHRVDDIPFVPDLKIDRRQSSGGLTAVTGITGLGTPARLEIRQLEQNTDQWNLYLLGLDRMMKVNESEKLSYYQIAGIHGRPYVPWDAVGPFPNNTEGPGYCTHVSNIFLPWHRPYLALYEQVLFSHIIEVVNTFPQGATRAKYAQAAMSWRHPYWDWAAPPPDGESVYPTSLTAVTVNVTLPNGTATIANPLLTFEFHPVSVSDFFYNPFATWPETKRYPTSWAQGASSQNNLVGPILDNNRVSFMDRLYNLFTNYHNFTQFGNEAWMVGSAVENADSLESIHDAIHAITGSSGHMTYLDYSAYDPIFWLHHGMIDRCFALFQALNPDTYVEPMQALEQTFTISTNEKIDVNSPLDPFHSDASGTKHTSTSVRDYKTLGYTYPELVGSVNVSTVRAAINKLYGSSVSSGALGKRGPSRSPTRDKRADISTDFSSTPGETASDGKRKEYLLNIQSQKFALNGSYAIYVFLGSFDEADPSCWALEPNLVGTHAVFAALPGDVQGNGQGLTRRSMGMSSIQVSGTMPLTSMLLTKVQSGDLGAMDDQCVEDYLTQKLRWKAALFDNTEVPLGDVAGLDVTVVRAEVEPATSSDTFPIWGEFVELKHITAPPC